MIGMPVIYKVTPKLSMRMWNFVRLFVEVRVAVGTLGLALGRLGVRCEWLEGAVARHS